MITRGGKLSRRGRPRSMHHHGGLGVDMSPRPEREEIRIRIDLATPDDLRSLLSAYAGVMNQRAWLNGDPFKPILVPGPLFTKLVAMSVPTEELHTQADGRYKPYGVVLKNQHTVRGTHVIEFLVRGDNMMWFEIRPDIPQF